jgi:hypothetical protein
MSTPCNVNGACSILTGTTTQRSKVLKPARGKQLNKAITLAFSFLFFIIFTGNVLYAQSGSSNTQTTEVASKEGTYQFIFRSPGSEQNIALTAVQLSAIENLRKDSEVVYAASVSNDYIKVKILPRSVISQAGSSSLPKYIFKSEMEYGELHNIRYAEIP